MRNLPFYFLRAVAFAFIVILFVSHLVHAQTPDAVTDLATRINRERIARGLTPYALNAQLTAAAQSHANDLARTGKYRTSDEGHIGSDGSTVFDRVARTVYGAYSWGRRLGENWAHYADTARAFSEWMDSPPHRNNILHALYREIGIGVAPAAAGGFIYIVDFGAQPNVLPFFINDISSETRAITVTLTLGDEQVSPSGDGASNIGHPIEMQISNTADFAGAKWQAYTAHIDWTLPNSAGAKTVYVKYRDAKGRTATANDSITLNIPVTPSPSATRTATRTPSPTMTATMTQSPTPIDTPTPQPTDPPTSTPTAKLPVAIEMPAASPTPIATLLPSAVNSFGGSTIIGGLGFVFVIMILLAVAKNAPS